MNKRNSIVGICFGVALLLGIYYLMPQKIGEKTKINSEKQKEVYQFIKSFVYAEIGYPDSIDWRYNDLNPNSIDYFLKLKKGTEQLNKNEAKEAWDSWWPCIEDDELENYKAETYFIIGTALGERDGFASFLLLSKALKIASSGKYSNNALEYVCLKSIIRLCASQAEDDNVIQEVDQIVKNISQKADYILRHKSQTIKELSPESSIYHMATEALFWLGDAALGEKYIDQLNAQKSQFLHPELTDAFVNISLGVKYYIEQELDDSMEAFSKAINQIGDERSYLDYSLELPYAYIGCIYADQHRFKRAIKYMQHSIKTLQNRYYQNIEDPLIFVDTNLMYGEEKIYNLIMCYLRLQYFYKGAIEEGDSSIDLNHVFELTKYTNELIKVWFLNAADEETLLRATKLMKKSNSNAIDLLWTHQHQFRNVADKVYRLQTEAQSFYLNYLIELRKLGKNNANYNVIRRLTLDLAKARQSDQQFSDANIHKQLALLRCKSELWSTSANELKHLLYKEKEPVRITKEKAVVKYFMSFNDLYVSYYTGNRKGWKKLPKADYKNIVNQLKRAVKSQTPSAQRLQQLYQLLIKPIAPELKQVEELTILSDEQLEGVPFELLKDENGVYLVNQFAINYSYTSNPNTNNQLTDFKTFLALAPGFEEGNNQVKTSLTRDIVEEYAFIKRSGGNRFKLASIPYSTDEVNAIGQMFNNRSIKNEVLTRKDATTENFVNHMSKAEIIHIATHGISCDNYKSGLFFTQSDSDDDGFLSFYELYDLDVNADLVVLSACKSGIGKVVEGEGVMALPRGFIYAGASNVIASLWKVHDEKTKELMVAFYQHLLNDKVSYAKALQLAKLDCINNGFLYLDWAGFVLISN
ncbi:MAG: CHAT domain-containing protein [Carboxylicivirga sp.]|jgi:CHAT domain-containing protein|nr:CHAT domain-containing protein [Carboxylicivirga sp.]